MIECPKAPLGTRRPLHEMYLLTAMIISHRHAVSLRYHRSLLVDLCGMGKLNVLDLDHDQIFASARDNISLPDDGMPCTG